METSTVVAFIFLMFSVLLLTFGYLIRVEKQLTFIAGVDPVHVRDQDGLARWIGNGLLIMGGIGVVVSLGVFALPNVFTVIVAVYVIGVVVGRLVLSRGAQKFIR